MEPLGSCEVQSEDDQGTEVELDQDPSNWQMSVPREILQGLPSQEIKRQEVIYGVCLCVCVCVAAQCTGVLCVVCCALCVVCVCVCVCVRSEEHTSELQSHVNRVCR